MKKENNELREQLDELQKQLLMRRIQELEKTNNTLNANIIQLEARLAMRDETIGILKESLKCEKELARLSHSRR